MDEFVLPCGCRAMKFKMSVRRVVIGEFPIVCPGWNEHGSRHPAIAWCAGGHGWVDLPDSEHERIRTAIDTARAEAVAARNAGTRPAHPPTSPGGDRTRRSSL